jgi:hypothetical protein
LNDFNFLGDASCGLLEGQVDDSLLGVCAEPEGGEVFEDVLESTSTSAIILRKFSENCLEKLFGIKMSLHRKNKIEELGLLLIQGYDEHNF